MSNFTSIKWDQFLTEAYNDPATITISEQEILDFLNEDLHEGLGDLWDYTKAKMTQMKDKGIEYAQKFVKSLGTKLVDLFNKLRQKRLIGKHQVRNEIAAVRLLMTRKHIELGVMILTALFKLTGGYVLDKVAKTPEIIEKIQQILTMLRGGQVAEAIKELFGDLQDVAEMVKKFVAYHKDTLKPAAYWGDWEEFGGLAEIEAAFNSDLELLCETPT
tara:strand:- start:74249 stop:74899 length:651 start_codon:yes stop_codon:yes gene_type:complete